MEEIQHNRTSQQEVSVFTSPQWLTIFFAISIPASLVPFLIGFTLGLSVSSDIVFGSYALMSGIFADIIIRRKFGRLLIVLRKPRTPFVILWVLLCLYVMLFKPLQ